MRTLTLLLTASLFISLHSFGQSEYDRKPQSTQEVTQVLRSDTVLFFYNKDWRLVFPVCAQIYRVSRVNNGTGYFDGDFIDYYRDSTIAVTGSYKNSLKDGSFQIFYENGQLAQKGAYIADKKTGIWEYFFEDGNKRMILDFKENELLMLELWDENQKNLVSHGNGNWQSRQDFAYYYITISGEVVNGRRNGTWTKSEFKTKVNSEKYENGKFISGKFLRGSEKYNSEQTLINVDINTRFEMAERFEVARCPRPAAQIGDATAKNAVVENAKYPGGDTRFFRELKEGLNLNLASLSYGIIRIGFIIAADGKMTDFRKLSSTGYEDQLIVVMMSMRNWQPRKINGVARPEYKTIGLNVADYMHNTDR